MSYGQYDLATLAALFSSKLHRAGLATSVDRASLFTRMISLLSPGTIGELYWCARIAFLSDIAKLQTFDRIFLEVFAMQSESPIENQSVNTEYGSKTPQQQPGHQGITKLKMGVSTKTATNHQAGDARKQDDLADLPDRSTASAEESLTCRNFATLSQLDLQLANELLESSEKLMPTKVTARTATTKLYPSQDIRATLRASVKTGGDPVELLSKGRVKKKRRLIFILDISGSMEPFASPYLYFLRGMSRNSCVESFVFSTHLTRITLDLRTRQSIESTFDGLSLAPDRFGGTRIAEALGAFLDTHGRRGMARGAMVIVVSDGWECGDVKDLKEQMRRLKLLSHRVLWVNPRKANQGYQPLVGGMSAVLPFCDGFFSGHSISSLWELLDSLEVTSKGPKRIPWESMR